MIRLPVERALLVLFHSHHHEMTAYATVGNHTASHVAGGTNQVCVSTFCDVWTTTKPPAECLPVMKQRTSALKTSITGFYTPIFSTFSMNTYFCLLRQTEALREKEATHVSFLFRNVLRGQGAVLGSLRIR